MKVAIFLAAVILSANAARNQNKRTGWSPPPTYPPSSGWNVPTEPPSGWNQLPPPPPGWNAPYNIAIDVTGSLEAVGQGWAGSNHAESVSASEDDDDVLSVGDAIVNQQGNVAQLTNNVGTSGQSANSVNVLQDAVGSQSLSTHVQGLQANLTHAGWSGASGAAASAAEANSHLQGN